MLPFKLDESYLGGPNRASNSQPNPSRVLNSKIKFTLPPPPKGHISTVDYSVLDDSECKHSELNLHTSSPELGATFEEQVKLFAHIHSDTLIKGSDLEGNSMKDTADYLMKIIPGIMPMHAEGLEKTFKSLSDDNFFGKDIEKHAENVTEKLLQLQIGDSHIMRFGWLGKGTKPGHAMAIEFVKQPNDKFQVHVYNTGAGTEFHERIAKELKFPISTVLEFSEVPASVLCFSKNPAKEDSAFIYYLLKAIVANREQSIVEVCEKEIYRALSLLLPYKIQADQAVIYYMTGQRSGTCSFRVLMAILIRKMQDLYPKIEERVEVYKTLKHQIKYQSLRKFYQKNSLKLFEDSPDASQARLLLKSAAIKFQRHTLKLFKPERGRQILSLDETQKAYDTSRELLNTITSIDAKITIDRKTKEDKVELNCLDSKDQNGKIKLNLEKVLSEQWNPVQVDGLIEPYKIPKYPEVLQPELFYNNILELEEWLLRTRNNGIPRTRVDLVDNFISKIPIPAPNEMISFWNKLNLNIRRTTTLLKHFDLILNDYLHDLDSAEEYAEQRNTIYALYAFIHFLSLNYESLLNDPIANLGKFGVYFPFKENNEDSLFNIYRSDTYERYMQIAQYFRPLQRILGEETLFNFESLREVTEDISKHIGDYLFFGKYLNDPGTIQRIFNICLPDSKEETKFTLTSYLIAKAYKEEFKKFLPPYIKSLQMAAAACQYISNHCLRLESADTNFHTNIFENGKNKEFKISFYIQGHFLTKRLKSRSLKNHRNFEGIEKFSNDSNKIITEKNPTENSLICEGNKDKKLILNVEPTIQPQGLLKYYHENLHFAEDAKAQTEFEILFFRHFWDNKKNIYIFPVKDLIHEDHTFISSVLSYLKEGFRLYYDKQPSLKPKIHALSFFIRVFVRSLAMLPLEEKNKYLNEIKEIELFVDQWIAREDLNEGEMHSLYLHRLSLSTISSSSEIESKELKIILKYWLLSLHSTVDDQWKTPSYFDEMTRWIFNHRIEIELACKRYPGEVDAALREVLSKVSLRNNFKDHLDIQFPMISLKDSEEGNWRIDLITGNISNENGLIHGPFIPDHTKDSAYFELFGSVKFPMRTVGEDEYYFRHPHYNLIKLLKSKSNGNLKIYRQDEKGIWWQYHSPLLFDALPGSLRADHSHWMKLGSKKANAIDEMKFEDLNRAVYIPSSNFIEDVQIYNKLSGDLVGEINSDGSIFHKGKKVILPQDIKQVFSEFELSDYILVQEDLVSFTRYRSREGSPLQFGFNNSTMVWKDNNQYSLSKFKPQGFIGTIPNALFLENNEGKISKVLIPLKPLLKPKGLSTHVQPKGLSTHVQPKGLSTHVQLDVIDESRKKEYEEKKSEYLCQQEGVYTYLEYDIKEETLTPLSSEGKYFKAYLELLQRNYEAGFNDLSPLLQADWISPKSLEILLNILSMGKKLPDQSSQAAAIRLHLIYALMKYFERPEHDKNIIAETLICLFTQASTDQWIYLDGLKNVPMDFRLSAEEELYLWRSVPGKLSKRRINNLKNKSINIEMIEAENFPVRAKIKMPEQLYFNKRRVFQNQKNNHVKDEIQFLKNPIVPINKLKFSPTTGGDFLYVNFNSLFNLIKGNQEERNYLKWVLDLIEVDEKDFLILNALSSALEMKDPPNPPKSEDAPELVLDWFFKFVQVQKEENTNIIEPKKTEPSREPILRLVNPVKSPSKNLTLKLTSEISNVSIRIANELLEPFKKPIETFSPDLVDFKGTIPLKDKENIYKKCVEHDLATFKKNYSKGRKRNLETEKYRFKEGQDISKMISCLESSIDKLENGQVDNCSAEFIQKKEILKLANQRISLSTDERQKELLKLTGGVTERLDMSKLIYFFLKKDVEGLKAANPSLKQQEIHEIFQKVGKYLVWNTELQKLKRSLKLAYDYLKEKDPLGREVLIKKIGSELQAPIVYDISTEHEALVFEYQSNMRIRRAQFDLVKEKMIKTNSREGKDLYNNLVAQLVMGGGKTSVLASLLGYLSAKPDRLSLFIVPGALFDSVKENLKKSQPQNFGQKVTAIDLHRQQFTPQKLRWLREQFQNAIQNQEMLVVKAEMIQSLALELVALSKSIANLKETDNLAEMLGKLDDLLTIVMILQDQTDALGDEIDVLLSVMKEVNFPEGAPSKVRSERIQLIREIYGAFENSNIKLSNGNSLRDFVKLHENKQSLISEEDYESFLRPALASHVADYVTSKYLPEGTKTSFDRFINGQMKANVQEIAYSDSDINTLEIEPQMRSDILFLRLFREYSNSKDPEKIEAANIIGLSRQMLKTVLSTTLTKNGNRHYGRALKNDTGEVVPYLGVGTPSTTHFGYHYELIAYHYQTASQQGVTKGQILNLAKAMKEAAVHFALKDNENIVETVEAKEFKKLTGVQLHQIEDPIQLKKALEFINDPKHPERALDVEANTISYVVKYYPSRFTCGPLMLVELISTFRAFCGIPWNFETFHPSLQDNVFLDDGSDGAIAHELLERSKKNPSVIHKVKSSEIKPLFDELLQNNSRRDKIRALKDGGGFFKHADNKQVAEDILKYYHNDPNIQAVVYFSKPEGKETSDTPSMIKKGPDGRFIYLTLDGTSEEDILKAGIPLNNIYYFYDERHCAGSDFPLPMGAVSFGTIDETIISRVFFQMVMRSRQLMDNQDIEYVIYKGAEHCFLNKASTLEDILLTAIKNQAIRKSKEVYRFFRQLIEHHFKWIAFASLIETLKVTPATKDLGAVKRRIEEVFEEYNDLLSNQLQESPKDEYGFIEEDIPTKKALIQYINFSKTKLKKGFPHWAEKHIVKIIEKIEKSELLPETSPSPSNHILGSEQEIELNNNIQVDTNINLDMDLKNELEQYNPNGYFVGSKENDWVSNLENSLEKVILSKEVSTNLKAHVGEFEYRRPFDVIFDDTILITHNARRPCANQISIFSRLQKPLDHLLIIKNGDQRGSHRVVCISRKESALLKSHLKQGYRSNKYNNVWLIQSDGYSIEPNPHQNLFANEIDREIIERMLLQVNFFNGNVQYLDNNFDLANSWLNESKADDKLHFLKLRVENMPMQRQIFYRSSLFQQNHSAVDIFAARYQKQKLIQQNMAALKPEYVPYVPLNNVRQIPPHLVKFLGNDELKIKRLSHEQVKFVDPTQVRFLSARQIPYLQTPEQLDQVADDKFINIQPNQIPHLSDKGIFRISNPDWIRYIPVNRVSKIREQLVDKLSDAQIQGLVLPEFINKIGQSKFKILLPSQIQYVYPENVEHLGDLQIQHLKTQEQISKLPDSRIRHIHKDHVKWIHSSKYSFLETEETIRAIPNPYVKKLKDCQVPFIGADQVPSLEDSKVSLLKTEEQIGALKGPQVKFIDKIYYKWLKTKSQIDHVANEDLNFIGPQVVIFLDDNRLKFITKPELAKEIAPLKVNFAHKLAVPHFDKTQVQNLTSQELINAIHENHVKDLKGDQVKLLQEARLIQQLAENYIRDIDPNLVTKLGDNQFKHLRKEELIKRVPDDKVNLIYEYCVSMLKASQVEHLEKRELVERLTPEQFKVVQEPRVLGLLASRQVKVLDPDAIRRLPDTQIKHLSADQVQYLTDKKIQHITDPEVIGSLDYSKIWYVNREAHQHLDFGAKIYAAFYFPIALIQSAFACILCVFLFITGFYAMRKKFKIWDNTTEIISYPAHIIRWGGGTPWPDSA